MKVVTILGTRPEIIRLSQIIPLLDKNLEHVLVHTGQNFDKKLSDIFFSELKVREPDYFLEARGDSYATQIAEILIKTEQVLIKEKPDKILILGDTNSGLSAIIAKRMNIPVFHMEAGNRCFDDRVPEELNRKIIDNSSSVLLPYTKNSQQFLLNEGFSKEKIIVTGNPINEVLIHYKGKIDSSTILNDLHIKTKSYLLATIHRAENVDDSSILKNIFEGFNQIVVKINLPLIVSLHPRTKQKLDSLNIKLDENIKLCEPFGFFDFVMLEKEAKLVLTDSGTVQEECCILKVPNITIRKTTERPETIECGSNILSGIEKEKIVIDSINTIGRNTDWTPPEEYLEENVSSKIISILSK